MSNVQEYIKKVESFPGTIENYKQYNCVSHLWVAVVRGSLVVYENTRSIIAVYPIDTPLSVLRPDLDTLAKFITVSWGIEESARLVFLSDIDRYIVRVLRFPGNIAEYKMDNRITDLSISVHMGKLCILEHTYMGLSNIIVTYPIDTPKATIETDIAKIADLIDESWFIDHDAKAIFAKV